MYDVLGMQCKTREKKNNCRFKYQFDPQPMASMSKWSLTFQLCQIGPQPFVLMSNWSLPLNDGQKKLTRLMILLK